MNLKENINKKILSSDLYSIVIRYHKPSYGFVYAVYLNFLNSVQTSDDIKELCKLYGGSWSKAKGIDGAYIFYERKEAEAFAKELEGDLFYDLDPKFVLNLDSEDDDNDCEITYYDEINAFENSDTSYTPWANNIVAEAFRDIVVKEGHEIIKSPNFVDKTKTALHDSISERSCFILKTMVDKKFTSKFLNIGEWGKQTQELVMDFLQETGFVPAFVLLITRYLAFALGWKKTSQIIVPTRYRYKYNEKADFEQII